MLFQTLDDKNECVAVYINNELKFKEVPKEASKTWEYSQFLKGMDIEYANIYCEGKTLDEACPEHLKKDWDNVKSKLKAFIRSFVESKVSMRDNCFFELTPKKFLIEYCKIKNQITEHIFQTYSRPQEYDFYRDMTEFLSEIKYRRLNVDSDVFKQNIQDPESLKLYRKYKDLSPYINYNLFGTITGRLSNDGFPILRFDKKHRHVLKPNNDYFVEIDINAAELRMALALSGKEQPTEDLYKIINETAFDNELTRKETKDRTIKWLYSESDEYTDELKHLFDKEFLLKKYYKGDHIITPYGRRIEAPERNAINYLMQSTFIDLFHRQVLKINKLLNGRGTYIPFLIHDCFYLDLKREDKDIIAQIAKEFSDTPYGFFKCRIKVGKDLSDLRELKL